LITRDELNFAKPMQPQIGTNVSIQLAPFSLCQRYYNFMTIVVANTKCTYTLTQTQHSSNLLQSQ